MLSIAAHKESRTRLKKAPLFDEGAYRTDFYEAVLQIQPLFLETVTDSSSLDQNGAKDPANQQTISLKPYILEKIKANLVDKVKTLNSENQSIDSAIANQDHLEQVLSNINELLNLTARHENQQLNELLQIEDTQLRDALFNILQNIYLVLQLSKDRDELKVFYEIDSHVCLKTLFSNEQSSSLTDAVSFLVNKFEEKQKSLLTSFLKKQPVIKKLISSKNVSELLKACQDEVKRQDQISKLAKEESEVKKLLFSENDASIISENIYYDVFGQKELAITQTSEALDPKKTQQIKAFSKASTSKYMSHSSISEYEQHILSFVNSVSSNLSSIEKEVFNAINNEISNFEMNLQKSTSKPKTALHLLFQEFLFPAIRNAMFSDPKIQQWLDLLFSKDDVMQWENINICFLNDKRLNTKELEQKKSLSNTTYVCSLVDGLNFVRLSADHTAQKNLELYSQKSHFSNEKSISSQEIKVNQGFNELLEKLNSYVKFVYENGEHTDRGLQRLRACVFILGMELNNCQELTEQDIEKVFAQISGKEEMIKNAQECSSSNGAGKATGSNKKKIIIVESAPQGSQAQLMSADMMKKLEKYEAKLRALEKEKSELLAENVTLKTEIATKDKNLKDAQEKIEGLEHEKKNLVAQVSQLNTNKERCICKAFEPRLGDSMGSGNTTKTANTENPTIEKNSNLAHSGLQNIHSKPPEKNTSPIRPQAISKNTKPFNLDIGGIPSKNPSRTQALPSKNQLQSDNTKINSQIVITKAVASEKHLQPTIPNLSNQQIMGSREKKIYKITTKKQATGPNQTKHK